jgi:hypothetical protein
MTDRNLPLGGGSANTPATFCCHARRRFSGAKVSGRSHGLVGRCSNFGGGIDQAAAGWFGERDDLVGRDLLWSHPPHSLKPGLALFDGDLGFALGSHRNDPSRSSQTRVIGGDLTGDISQLDGGNHAAVKRHGGRRQINPARDLIWGRPAGLIGDRRANSGAKLAGRLN